MTKVIQPPKKYSQFFLLIIGLIFRIINKIRHLIIGYASPRPFSSRDIERSVEYTLSVVANWEKALMNYIGSKYSFDNKHVLELGPGPDLGTGFVILALGAQSYTAIDKYELISQTPKKFYKTLFGELKKYPGYKKAQTALDQFQKQGFSDYFSYIYEPSFSLNNLPLRKFDVLVSQAVLEHLDDARKTFEALQNTLSVNAIMVHEVDLGTHTRWVRTLDPLNLLRYSDIVYDLLSFNGSPNRLRMSDYQEILDCLGFEKIETKQIIILDKGYVKKSRLHLSEKFRRYPDEDIETKSFYLLATKR